MGGFAPTGGSAGVKVEAQIDVEAMPHILRRIVMMALKTEADPGGARDPLLRWARRWPA